MEKNVHTEHCCAFHGCKYGDIDCPVTLGYQKQSFPCEECSSWGKGIPEISEEEYKERRRRLNDFVELISSEEEAEEIRDKNHEAMLNGDEE